jgi:hypothetical protein
MRKLILSLFLVPVAFAATAADSTGHSRIYISVGPQYFFNTLNLKHDYHPANVIQPINTVGYSAGLDFERVTRHGLVFNAGVRYGIHKHNFNVIRDYSNFDPEATIALKGRVSTGNVAFTLPFVSPHIMTGYRRALNSDWAITVKGGFSLQYYFGEYQGDPNIYDLRYTTDDQTQERNTTGTKYLFHFSQKTPTLYKSTQIEGTFFNRYLFSYQVYLGTEKQLNKKWIKNVSAGLEFSRLVFGVFPADYTNGWYVTSYTTYMGRPGTDWYIDRNVSVGLRFSVGLWK